MSAKFPSYKYGALRDAMPDIVAEYIGTGKPTGELYKKYSKLVARPFLIETLMVTLNRKGASQARKIANFSGMGGGKTRNIATPQKIRALARTAATAKKLLEDRGLEHTYGMIEKIDKADAVLTKRKLNDKNLGRHLSELDKFDQVARRTFNMDEGEAMTPQQWQIGVLLQVGADNLQPSSPTMALDCTETAQEALESSGSMETAETG